MNFYQERPETGLVSLSVTTLNNRSPTGTIEHGRPMFVQYDPGRPLFLTFVTLPTFVQNELITK